MKKFMFFLMVLGSFVASVMMITVLALGGTALPVIVLALRGVLIAGCVILIVKKSVSWVRRGELAAYYLLEAAIAVFNLVYLSVFFPVDVRVFEFAITGSLITPVLNLVLVFILRRANKYVTFDNIGEVEEADSSTVVAAQALKQN